jgi:5-(carboxyamino)imidazole ribonucleotide synthase
MMAMAARVMGYRVRVLDPDPACPASFISDEVVTGHWGGVEAARTLATGCDAVTLEIEQIGQEALRAVADQAPLRPGIEAIRIIQDKILQKTWLRENGFPVGAFETVERFEDLAGAVSRLGGKVFLKTARGGYDGRGQARIGLNGPADAAELRAAWEAIGARPAVAEQALGLDVEISVMAARNPSGEVRVYPASRNHHENQILAWSVTPAGVSDAHEAEAGRIAAEMAAKLHIEGLLCVECFITRAGELLVNELAPRPHNSYHQSERACVTGQFEQAVRAALNLPLGETALVQPAAIMNLLGDLWLDAPGGQPDFARVLETPGVRLHLYEKHTPRRARKMGHLSAAGATAEEALARARQAFQQLR